MYKKFNAAELVVQGVATFSSGGETTDWSFQISEILQEMLCDSTGAASEQRVFSMTGHVMYSRRENLRVCQ